MEEKEDLQNIKQGLIQTISSSSWAIEKETGEVYIPKFSKKLLEDIGEDTTY